MQSKFIDLESEERQQRIARLFRRIERAQTLDELKAVLKGILDLL